MPQPSTHDAAGGAIAGRNSVGFEYSHSCSCHCEESEENMKHERNVPDQARYGSLHSAY